MRLEGWVARTPRRSRARVRTSLRSTCRDRCPTSATRWPVKPIWTRPRHRVEARGRRALAVAGDVRSQADLDRAVAAGLEQFGKIDIVIANAGIWDRGPDFWELTEEQWDTMIAIDLTGVWKTVKAAVPSMIERRSGSVVVTSSVNGLEPGDHYTHYSTAKHGVIGLMKNMALELAPHGVRCNALCPGATDTALANYQQAYDMFAGHPGGTREEMLQGGRHFAALRNHGWLDPQLMADAALFLTSDLARAITGIVVPVEAGHLFSPAITTRLPVRTRSKGGGAAGVRPRGARHPTSTSGLPSGAVRPPSETRDPSGAREAVWFSQWAVARSLGAG